MTWCHGCVSSRPCKSTQIRKHFMVIRPSHLHVSVSQISTIEHISLHAADFQFNHLYAFPGWLICSHAWRQVFYRSVLIFHLVLITLSNWDFGYGKISLWGKGQEQKTCKTMWKAWMHCKQSRAEISWAQKCLEGSTLNIIFVWMFLLIAWMINQCL